MYHYLNRDSKEGWLRWFSAEHWVSPVLAGINIPATIINRSSARYGVGFIACRSQAPVKLGEVLAHRLREGRAMYPTILGEPPQDMGPADMVKILSRNGIWIDPTLELNVPTSLLTKLSQTIVSRNGLMCRTYGIFDKLLSGSYPGVAWSGPRRSLGSLMTAC